MNYVLLNENGELRLSPTTWTAAMGLAGRYGWEPRGTVRQMGWGGCYVTPAGQMVTPRDAATMALALEDALDDVPHHDARPVNGTRKATLIEASSGAERPRLVALTDFLREGPFLIHASCGAHTENPRHPE